MMRTLGGELWVGYLGRGSRCFSEGMVSFKLDLTLPGGCSPRKVMQYIHMYCTCSFLIQIFTCAYSIYVQPLRDYVLREWGFLNPDLINSGQQMNYLFYFYLPGARGAHDAEQEVLRRNRARSVLKEQKDPDRACAAALHSHHESERQA